MKNYKIKLQNSSLLNVMRNIDQSDTLPETDLEVFIHCDVTLTGIYIRIFTIRDFNIQIYIIPYIHGLDLHVIFTDWTDTEDIYIYLYCGSPESGGIFYRHGMCFRFIHFILISTLLLTCPPVSIYGT